MPILSNYFVWLIITSKYVWQWQLYGSRNGYGAICIDVIATTLQNGLH